MHNEDPKLLAKKIIKLEDMTRKSGEVQQKLEDELVYLRKQLSLKQTSEELLKSELKKTKHNYHALQAAYTKLSHEYLCLSDLMREKKHKRHELTRSLKTMQIKMFDDQSEKSKKNLEKTVQSLENRVDELSKKVEEKEWIAENNMKNMQHIKEELIEQLKITRNSEVRLKASLEKVQNEIKDKETMLNGYMDKIQLAEDSLLLFYETVKGKEKEIMDQKL
jgi:chromosome segregation ATPase